MAARRPPISSTYLWACLYSMYEEDRHLPNNSPLSRSPDTSAATCAAISLQFHLALRIRTTGTEISTGHAALETLPMHAHKTASTVKLTAKLGQATYTCTRTIRWKMGTHPPD